MPRSLYNDINISNSEALMAGLVCINWGIINTYLLLRSCRNSIRVQMQENNEGAKNLSIYKRSEKVTRHWLMVARLLMRKREWVVLGWAELFPRPACPEPAS